MAVLVKHPKNVSIADDAAAAAAGQVVPSDWNATHTFTGTANTVLAFDGSGNATELSTTGTGDLVKATSPSLTTPSLGTPSSVTLTNATGLPLATGVTGTLAVANGGSGVTTSTGTGDNVLATSPTLVTPILGTPASGTLTNCTFPTFNQNTTGTAAGLSATLVVGSGGSGATTLTGVLKGNGTSAFSAATAGTDYVAPATATSFTAAQTFAGSSSAIAAVLANAAETTTVSATAATGTIAFDVTTQAVLYYTSDATANWTVNFRGSSGTSLNTLLATGQSVTVAFLVTQGATAYYNSAVQVDGTSVTPKWQGGTAPTSGNASGIDVYAYTIIKTGSAAFTVLASQTQFK